MNSGITLVSNVPAISGVHQFNRLSNQIAKINERLQTGKRINHASDGPSSMIRVVNLETRLSSMNQAQQNVSNAKALTGIAQGGAESVVSTLQTIRTKVHEALNGDLTSEQRSAIDAEITGLVAALDDTERQTNFEGTALLDGSYTGKRFQTGPDAADNFIFGVTQDFSSTGLSVDSMDVSDSANAATALASVDAALDSALAELSNIGSTYQRLETIEKVNEVAYENTMSALSTVRDADPLLEQVNLLTTQMKQQAAVASIGNAINAQSMLLSLIGG